MALEVGIDPSQAWQQVKNLGRNARNQAGEYATTLASQSVTVEYAIFNIYAGLRAIRNQLQTLAATADLNAYVQVVRDDATYDAVANINTVVSEINDCLAWIDANASGLTLTGDSAESAIANGSVATNRFSPTQTSQLQTRLSDIVAAINAS